jgi:hypothetical protein
MPFCANCGSEVAANSPHCPNCGHPQGAGLQSTAYGRRTDGQAVASMVLGIAGLVLCPLICSIIAIVLGNQAKTRIAHDPSLDGEGMAKAGVIMGWIGVGLGILGIVGWVLAFAFAASSPSF